MKIRSVFAVAFCIAALSPLAAKATPVQPNTGFYRILPYVSAATPTGNCTAFGIATGPGAAGSFYYPGPSATGAVYRYATSTSTAIVAQTFSKTPAAGATTWNGTVEEGNEPNPSFKIPFKATITYLDSQSFTTVFTYKVTVGAKACTITENIAFYQTGS
jgi:hypothetical protein